MAKPPPPIPGVPRGKLPSVREEDGRRRTLPGPIPIRREEPTSIAPTAVEPAAAPHSRRPDFGLRKGDLAIEARGWVAMVLIACFAAGAGGFCAGRYLHPPTQGEVELSDALGRLRTDLAAERKARIEQADDMDTALRAQRAALRGAHTANAHNFSVLGAALRGLGAKVEWQGGSSPEDIDMHPAPLPGSKAPKVQPRAVLEPAPEPP